MGLSRKEMDSLIERKVAIRTRELNEENMALYRRVDELKRKIKHLSPSEDIDGLDESSRLIEVQ
jgi:hypothetical protein